jgi:hypothetical protein
MENRMNEDNFIEGIHYKWVMVGVNPIPKWLSWARSKNAIKVDDWWGEPEYRLWIIPPESQPTPESKNDHPRP